MRCKIADFGLAREAAGTDETYYRSKNGQLPVRWSAPEALDEQRFTEKTDVWSCGVLFYEIQTKAATPYEGWSNQRTWVEVTAGYRLPQPVGCDDGMYAIIMACWAAEPKTRLTFAALVLRLRQHLTEVYDHSFDVDKPSPGGNKSYRDEGHNAGEEAMRGSGVRRLLNLRPSRSAKVTLVNPTYLSSSPTSAVDSANAAIYDMGSDDNAAMDAVHTAIYDMGSDENAVSMPARQPLQSGASAMGKGGAGTVAAMEDDIYFNTAQGRTHDTVGSMTETGFSFNALAEEAETDELVIGPSDVGKRVSVQGYSCGGVLRFYGDHKSKQGKRCGVELDAPQGKNNGTVDVCMGRRGELGEAAFILRQTG